MTEQQKFEAHMREQFGWEDRDFRSESCGSYFDSHTAAAWQAWQARAAQDKSAELLEALEEVVAVFESNPSSITDTVWVTGNRPETLYDHCRAAISKARGE